MDLEGKVGLVERLGRLRDRGALTEGEFEKAKEKVFRTPASSISSPSAAIGPVPSETSRNIGFLSQPQTARRAKWAAAVIFLLTIAVLSGTWLGNIDVPLTTQSEAAARRKEPVPLASGTVSQADVAAVDAALNVDTQATSTTPDPPKIAAPAQSNLVDSAWLAGWWNRFGDPTCDGDAAEEFQSGGGWESWSEKGRWRLANKGLSISLTYEREGYSDNGTKLPVTRVREGKITAATHDSFNWNTASETVKFVRCRDA